MTVVKTAAQILADIEASTVPDWPDETLSTAQAARAMGISQASLREWTKAGKVPYIKGKYRRYRLADIAEWTSANVPDAPRAGTAALAAGGG